MFVSLLCARLMFWFVHFAGEGEEGSKEVAMLARAIHAANGGTARYKKPLSATQWSLAFDGFAVSAAVCGMMPYTTAMAHKAGSLFTLCLLSVLQLACFVSSLARKLGRCPKQKESHSGYPSSTMRFANCFLARPVCVRRIWQHGF